MQRGTLFPFCCSRMNWWIISVEKTNIIQDMPVCRSGSSGFSTPASIGTAFTTGLFKSNTSPLSGRIQQDLPETKMTIAAKYRQAPRHRPPQVALQTEVGNLISRRSKMVYKLERDSIGLALWMSSSKLLVITTFLKIT